MTDHPFLRLLGQTIDEVVFVRNYVQVRFSHDYSILTCVSNPVVRQVGANEVRFPEPGSRDALCRLIETGDRSSEPRIENVTFAEGHSLEIGFSTGDVLAIPLVPEKPGWECINFAFEDGGRQQLYVE